MGESTAGEPGLRVVTPAEPPEVTPAVAAVLLRLLLAVAADRGLLLASRVEEQDRRAA